MREKESILTFPPPPFLLINEEGYDKYFVVESWEETDIQVLRDCHFAQNVIFCGHKASEEEIENKK